MTRCDSKQTVQIERMILSIFSGCSQCSRRLVVVDDNGWKPRGNAYMLTQGNPVALPYIVCEQFNNSDEVENG